MEFKILGPLEVVTGGSAVDIRARRQRILLAMLLLEANRVVPVDRLVDAVWGEDPPVTARSQVQICIYGIRRKLADAGGGDPIATRPPGYGINIPREALDSQQFIHWASAGLTASREGRLEEAAQCLRAALELWRGEVLSDIDSEAVRKAAVRLTEQRLVVWEERIDIELELKRHHEITPDIAALVAENPLRERFRLQQMLALRGRAAG